MTWQGDSELAEALAWCGTLLGPCSPDLDHTRLHPGQRAAVVRIRAAAGAFFVKIHRDPAHWANEVHAYEHWAPAFGARAPRLLGARDRAPLALLLSELAGQPLEDVALAPDRARAVWHAAGQALAALHASAAGDFYGPCRREGSPAGVVIRDARDFLDADFEQWLERGSRIACLTARELAIVRAARLLLGAFADERPAPCHRDYCPANWLVDERGAWSGVIDFEFAGWDVRMADVARDAHWTWTTRPELIDAMFDGYGWPATPEREQQRIVANTLYALGAIVWGLENDYRGFAAEGQDALERLGALLAD